MEIVDNQKELKAPDVFKGLPLDDFQKNAIENMLDGNSVIVAAPTGAGKTLIAEFLIEYALSRNESIVYTAPIKALSSQKYRDFSKEYGSSVGILTGDVVINREASVRMMTTEIFRNMLLEDSHDLINVKYVIFDEVHYLSDIDRGTVWEESIIFAPESMRFLCLSATVPNASELAQWISELKKHEVKVIKNSVRPVPLEHFAFFPEKKKAVLIEELHGNFFKSSHGFSSDKNRSKKHTGHLDLIRYISSKGRTPLVFFLFSRLKCFDYAQVASRIFDFTDREEKRKIKELFFSIVNDETIKEMKKTIKIYDFLRKGIAIHNAGILPVIKEAVEILFCHGLIKVLYCTETFALGINMPAKSVAFDSVRKYDGRDFRNLSTREYYQMAGRAGRRGMDEKGFVYSILSVDRKEGMDIKNIVSDPVEPLESQFSLSYNTVLNLLKLNDMTKIEKVLSSNFGQFRINLSIKDLKKEFSVLKKWRSENFCSFNKISVSSFGKFYRNRKKMTTLCENMIDDYKFGLLRNGKKPSRGRIKNMRKQFMEKLGILPCPGCENYGDCKKVYLKKYIRYKELKTIVNNYSEQIHLEQFERKISFLKELGYLDNNNELTARGELASRIHGHEIAITEMFFTGMFEKYDVHDIACFITAVVYEKRRNDKVSVLDMPRSIVKNVNSFANILEPFVRKERQYKFSTLETIETEMLPITYFWSKGYEFDDIMKLTNMEEGDVIRTLRRVIDMLRQILTAVRELPATCEKIRNVIRLLKRSVVDPENDFD